MPPVCDNTTAAIKEGVVADPVASMCACHVPCQAPKFSVVSLPVFRLLCVGLGWGVGSGDSDI